MQFLSIPPINISIHALRVEGDILYSFKSFDIILFLSTPSGWRATITNVAGNRRAEISIHALRVEGDGVRRGRLWQECISIHALRVEGDSKNRQSFHLFLRKREKNLPL